MTASATPPRRTRRRRRIANPRRFAILVAVAGAALVAGVVVGALHVPSERRMGVAYAQAWARRDYGAMYALLSDDARGRTSRRRFARAYVHAANTLTLEWIEPGRVRKDGHAARLEVTMRTRIFGILRGVVRLPAGDRAAGGDGVDWRPDLVFPGLRPGETLRRTTVMPPRAELEARDGSALAKGPNRTSSLGPLAAQVAGTVGPAPASRAKALAAEGVPKDASVGLTGLEREFDDRLSGIPGGTLYADHRVLARRAPVRGEDVRTSIDPTVQTAAVEALAGRYGGIAVVRPRTGEVLALAGIAYSAPQPPGSTFKIVTLAGVLAAHVARRTQVFPYETYATLSGVRLQNANGESCGGSLETAFANSCNSVFAPLGAKLGAQRLVRTAERFGFNEDPGLAGAARSTIPPAEEIGDDLAVGSSAIGQGKVQATPLQMALIAAAIGERGVRRRPTLLKGGHTAAIRATTPAIARTIGRFLRAVVVGGTGAAAAVPGVQVAGKTGTAELRTTVHPVPTPDANGVIPPQPAPAPNDTSDTDAWFTAFAPLHHPRVAVCVLLVGQGAGGATAAPAARTVLAAALRGRG
jgi:cell division protein FtsI/penicillin-binding protein 2